ncbi:MAG TPA: glutathione S-transferase family protein [Nevskiaceae bacterium]|nr:glutathione S-transferase family protein [Nevskiaceae bacterium]
MSQPVTIIGTYLSPYVRKVLAVLHLKNIDYRIDPIVGFMGNDEFSRISPLRRIPVLVDDAVTLCDSSVICEYLDERYPQVRVYPRDIGERARARWLEEYADTRMGDVFIWQLFNQRVIAPHLFGKTIDETILRRALNQEIPQVLDHLESFAPRIGLLFGEVTVADLALAVFFRNAAFARWSIDAQRWPRTAAYVERVLELDCLKRLRPYEDLIARTRPPQQRAALAGLGAPLTPTSYAASRPRPGIMRI